MLRKPQAILTLLIAFSMGVLIHPGPTAQDARASILPSALSVDFSWNPPNLLAGGNISFTPIVSGATPPWNATWDFGDGKTGATNSTINGGMTSHVYMLAGNYNVVLTVKDSASATATKTHLIVVLGSPLNINGWLVNWNISQRHGIEIYNVTHNGIPTIRDGILTGILVRYKDIPPPPYLLNFCLFFDTLDFDDLNTSIAGFSLQYSPPGPDQYFQIRANYNPAEVGYNYTEIWRFYQSGRFDAELAVSHLGCGRDHIYEPHWRIALTVGNPTNDIMSQYTTGGTWQNLVWEGNYTDNAARDPAHNSTEWRIGDGSKWYYMAPTASLWATDLPYIPPKIYLLRDHPNETGSTYLPDNPNIDPIVYANGELAYRQQLAFWFLPDYWDHWLGLPATYSYPGSEVTLSFYPNNL